MDYAPYTQRTHVIPVAGWGHVSLSVDREHVMDGHTRLWDEFANQYMTDPFGEVLTFPHPYEAQGFVMKRKHEHGKEGF